MDGNFTRQLQDSENINCPTLIMCGKEDQWIPVTYADQFENDIHHTTKIIYPEMGHVIMEEEPEITAMEAMNFIIEKE